MSALLTLSRSSTSCATCRQRHVKCDRQKPSCDRCLCVGWICPGYEKHWTFHIETTATRQGAASQRSTLSRSSALRAQAESLERSSRSQTSSLLPRPGKFQQRILSVGSTDGELLRLNFISRLESNALAARLGFISARPLLLYIPQRIGLSRALDNAVACVCAASASSIPTSSAASGLESQETDWRSYYSSALCALRNTLDSVEEARKPETLICAMLLQMLEQYVDSLGEAWMRHSQGVINLIKCRDPRQIRDDAELAILKAELGNILFASVKHGRDCFLAADDWSELLRSGYSKAKDEILLARVNQAQMELSLVCVHFPGLLSNYKAWRENDIMQGSTFALRLVDLLSEHRLKLLAWLAQHCSGFHSGGFSNTMHTASAVVDESSMLSLGMHCAAAIFLVLTDHILIAVRRDPTCLGTKLPTCLSREILDYKRAAMKNFTLVRKLNTSAAMNLQHSLNLYWTCTFGRQSGGCDESVPSGTADFWQSGPLSSAEIESSVASI